MGTHSVWWALLDLGEIGVQKCVSNGQSERKGTLDNRENDGASDKMMHVFVGRTSE